MSILLPQHLTRAMHVYTEHSKSAVGDVVMVWDCCPPKIVYLYFLHGELRVFSIS